MIRVTVAGNLCRFKSRSRSSLAINVGHGVHGSMRATLHNSTTPPPERCAVTEPPTQRAKHRIACCPSSYPNDSPCRRRRCCLNVDDFVGYAGYASGPVIRRDLSIRDTALGLPPSLAYLPTRASTCALGGGTGSRSDPEPRRAPQEERYGMHVCGQNVLHKKHALPAQTCARRGARECVS